MIKKFIFTGCALTCSHFAIAGSSLYIPEEGYYSASVMSNVTWEAAVNYNIGITNICKYKQSPSINTLGLDVTGLYNLKENHYITCRLSYAHGNDSDFVLNQWAIMPGYRYEYRINEQCTAFAGAFLGLGYSTLDYAGIDEQKRRGLNRKDEMLNVQYSLEAGARYTVAPDIELLGAITFNGGTSPILGISYDEGGSEEQASVGARIGVGFKF